MTLHEPDWYTAREAAACAKPLPAEEVELLGADRRVLAEDVCALTDLPGFDTSAMDGWAVAGAGPWRVVGSVLAGGPPDVSLRPGEASVIATGAALPPGADAVVRTEDGSTSGDWLKAPHQAAGTDIRPRGEECRQGDVLGESGTVLTPARIGSLAAAGHDGVLVRRRPAVAVVLFGDELVMTGVAGVGRVRDSLGPQLPGWLERLGAAPISVGRAADTLDDHVRAIAAARSGADILITTGGTAAGPVDHLHTAVAALSGRFVVDSVAVRPGHPMALADLGAGPGARWLLALPGNPASAVVSLLTLGAPLIDSILGRRQRVLGRVSLASDATAPPHEHRLLACLLDEDGTAAPVAHLGSAMLRGLAQADGFAVLPPGGACAGDTGPWLPLPA